MLGWLSWLILARTLKVAGSKPGRGPHYFHFFLAILNKQLKELIIAWSYNGGGGGGSRPFLSGCHRNQKGLDRTDTDVGGQRRRLVDISGHLWICALWTLK